MRHVIIRLNCTSIQKTNKIDENIQILDLDFLHLGYATYADGIANIAESDETDVMYDLHCLFKPVYQKTFRIIMVHHQAS